VHRGNTDRYANDITLEPIWLPHWPAWRCTISLILVLTPQLQFRNWLLSLRLARCSGRGRRRVAHV